MGEVGVSMGHWEGQWGGGGAAGSLSNLIESHLILSNLIESDLISSNLISWIEPGPYDCCGILPSDVLPTEL